MSNAAREQALQQWIAEQCQHTISNWRMISGDASFRRYFRYQHQGQSIVAVDAPPERENVQGFLALAHTFKQHQLTVPNVYASAAERGFWLLEDFGDHLLFKDL